ncbi:protein disulfide-isomerase-like [Photinus pyralis]|uniref:protein disulfide-isomerase-like n=1 Tax=Photinus pyralis TaxID=7054 RepID=UPI001266F6B9|nr:protein disulfide-isomerase-like [Photinus pyralis]
MNVLHLITTFTLCTFCKGEVTKVDGGVVTLTKQNFNSFISTNAYVFVKFYAPTCGYCKLLAPEYSKVGEILLNKGSSVALAEVDATLETSLAKEYGIKGYPTIKLFRNGAPLNYTGGRTSEEIARWLNKKTGPPAQNLINVVDAKTLIDENEAIAIGFFEDKSSKDARGFLQVADENNEFVFGITSDPDIFREYSANDGDILVYNRFNGRKLHFNLDLSVNNLHNVLFEISPPLLTEYNVKSVRKFFEGEIKDFLFLFLRKSVPESSNLEEEARSVARSFKGKVLFITVDADKVANKELLDYLEVPMRDVPTMRIVNANHDSTSFIPESYDVTANTIEEFVQSYLNGELYPTSSSEELPDDWNKGTIYKLVGSNFYSVVFDAEKDVLVNFHVPWSRECQGLAPIFAEVSEHLRSDDGVVFAQINVQKNFLKYTRIQSVPTIQLCRRGDNEIITYEGDFTFEGIIQFLQANGVGRTLSENNDEI